MPVEKRPRINKKQIDRALRYDSDQHPSVLVKRRWFLIAVCIYIIPSAILCHEFRSLFACHAEIYYILS